MGPLDSCGPRDGDPAAPPFRGACFKLPSRSKAFGSHPFKVRFRRFPGPQIFIYKRLLISSSRICFVDGTATEQQNVYRMRGRNKQLTKRGVHRVARFIFSKNAKPSVKKAKN